jgi:AraC-like DNA-binding protein/GGDEF domain-containing protein
MSMYPGHVAQIEHMPAPLASRETVSGGLASYSVVALLDIDDFVVARLARGPSWAAAEVATIEALTAGEREQEPLVSSLYRLEPDEWIFVLTGAEPDALGKAAHELAERLRAQVAKRTDCTATVSLGGAASGPDQVERTLSEAVQANQHKLVLGGNRVITATHAAEPAGFPSPERIENELSQKLRVGDQEGALRVLKDWITKSAELEGVTPEVLRSWLAAEILFALNVVGERRLSDGSMDWLEIFGKTSFDELLAMGTIHEQSYLGLWLERLFERIFQQTRTPQTSGRHILKLVESYIHEHYAEDLSLTKVAQAVFVSPFYISHLFHRELDTTFLRYLTAMRIARARQLLLDTNLQVSEIGALVGYGTAKNFRCAFKRVVGSTPSEFRSRA